MTRLVVCLFFAGCTPHVAEVSEQPEPKPVVAEGRVSIGKSSRAFIDVQPVEQQSSGPVVRAPARVAFKDGSTSQLGAAFSGRVVKVHVQTGDAVAVGDALVTLDCPDAAAARTTLQTATAAWKEANVSFDREKRMLEQGVGIEREKLAAETRLSDAAAELARAQSAIAFAGPGSGTKVTLRAPIAGKVIALRATLGSTVQAGGEPVVELGDPAGLWVVAEVFERDVASVHEGARAMVELPSAREPLEGKVTSIGTMVATALRTVPVRIELKTFAQVRPGMYGRARIESNEAGISVPTEAVLIRDGRETAVYVETSPLNYLRKAVVVAQPVEGRVQVLSGLAPGEKVVVKGALLLDGSADQLL